MFGALTSFSECLRFGDFTFWIFLMRDGQLLKSMQIYQDPKHTPNPEIPMDPTTLNKRCSSCSKETSQFSSRERGGYPQNTSSPYSRAGPGIV
jgi:hypothetical protein